MCTHSLSRVFVLLAAFSAVPVQAVSTGRLPPWVCGNGTPPLFSDGFETGGDAPYRAPSGGSGGAYPGAQMRSITVAGQPHDYYLHVPTGYPYAEPVPVLMVLHGAAGAGSAPWAAQWLRDDWGAAAQTGGFIVVAPIASGPSSGSWLPPVDYPMLKAVLQDVAAHYNIDRSRIHGWGFSAGGHVMHDLALRQRESAPDIRTFAAYGVSAGTLATPVCNPGNGIPSCTSLLPQVAGRIPVSLRVGSNDPLKPYVQSDRSAFIAAGWTQGGTLDFVVFPGEHDIYPAQFLATWQFFCPFQRLPE